MPDRPAWLIVRPHLYDLVWSEPLLDVAKRFGVSDVAVGKACDRHNIPKPGVGYWAKVKAGKRVPRRPLPPPMGTPHEIYFGTDGWHAGHPDDIRRWTPEKPPEPEPLRSARRLRAHARKLVGEVPIPFVMSDVHKLTERMIAGSHGDPQQPSLRPVDRRRLRLVNAIMLAAERAGARPRLPHDPDWFFVTVGREHVAFRIDRVRPSAKSRAHPSELDRLRLKIAPSGPTWTDRDDNLIDYHLQEIVAELFAVAEEGNLPLDGPSLDPAR